jgi:hypothetical protein
MWLYPLLILFEHPTYKAVADKLGADPRLRDIIEFKV